MLETYGYWSLVPPLAAIVLAIITQRVLVSLAAALVAGGLLIGINSSEPWMLVSSPVWHPLKTLYNVTFNWSNIQIILFVVLFMMTMGQIALSGGLQAIVGWMIKYIRGPRSAQFITVLAGFIIFMDDYANTMLVGGTMRPITDHHRVSRAKLAFLVDATSAPIAGLSIVSTWIGYEVGLFSDMSKSLALGKDGYAMFFDAIGFRFYCWFMIIFVFITAISGLDFGTMARSKFDPGEAAKAGKRDPFTEPHEQARPTAAAAIVPIGALLVMILYGLWWDGGGISNYGFGGIFNLSLWPEVLSKGDSSLIVLMTSAGVSLLLGFFLTHVVARVPLKAQFYSMWLGIKTACIPLAILILAWSLKAICDDLGTGTYIAQVLGDKIAPFLFPTCIYIAAGITAFATGTSWGTMAILIPTGIPLAFALDGNTYGIITIMSLGAVLDGAIFGDHCSPISDTTVLSSIASQCDHIEHVRTQIPYSLLVSGVAMTFGYIPGALGVASWISILSGGTALLFVIGGLYLRKRMRGGVTGA